VEPIALQYYNFSWKFGKLLIWQFGGLKENRQIKFHQY